VAIQNVCILGATGSIGKSTLDVISQHPDRYCAFALSANTNFAEMLQLCHAYRPVFAVMVDEASATALKTELQAAGLPTEVLSGELGLVEIAQHSDVSIVMAAIVGAAGLLPNLAAVRAGKRVLLANKESLVMSGALFMAEAERSGALLLPIDSEHNAIYQCLPNAYRCGERLPSSVRRILLTASGGPFRTHSLEDLQEVTPEQACLHPNWSMGQKISVDSASLMNKGLELIEACWLFNVSPSNVDVHIHPQSVVHSMVEYNDGSVLAQLGNPDMRTPIAYGMAWPERIDAGVSALDLFAIKELNFERPDLERFPCLGLASRAFEQGGTACATLNAANEVAVSAFLKGNIGFTAIPDIISRVLDAAPSLEADSIESVLLADKNARVQAGLLV
jgi:1-deoxy-D-xylulose-5-phosphate reductoisomerase